MNNTKNKLLIALALVAFMYGAVAQYFAPGASFSKIDMLFMLIGTTLSFMWYYYDSIEVEYRRGALLNIAVIAIGVIAFPYYFFRTRGFKKGLLYTGLFVLVVIAWSALQLAGAYAVRFGIQS